MKIWWHKENSRIFFEKTLKTIGFLPIVFLANLDILLSINKSLC